MNRHPVTPMNEADLRVHLQRQGVGQVESIDWRCYAAGEAALQSEVSRKPDAKPDAVLFDVLDDAHLRAIGTVIAACASKSAPLLAVGASSVAQLESNVAAADLELTDSDVAQLTAASDAFRPIQGAGAYARIIKNKFKR